MSISKMYEMEQLTKASSQTLCPKKIINTVKAV